MAQQFQSPLLAPDLQRKQMEFQQNQLMAKALMQQGMQTNEGRMVSGHYVRPDAGRAVANAFNLYAGLKGMQDAPQQMADLQKAQQDSSLSGFGFNPTPQQLGASLADGGTQTFPVGPSGSTQQTAIQQPTGTQPMLLPGFDENQSRNMLLTMGPQAYAAALARGLNARSQSPFAPQQSTAGFFQSGPDGVTMLMNPATGDPLMPVTADPSTAGQVAQAKAEGQETGKQTAQAKFNLPSAMADADQMLSTIDKVIDAPGLDDAVGMIQGRLPPWNTKGTDFVARLGQLQGQVFLQAYQKLKGAGVITDFEGAKAEQAMAALTRVQSEDQFREALTTLRDIVTEAKKRIQAQAGAQPEQPQPQQQDRSSQLDSILGF